MGLLSGIRFMLYSAGVVCAEYVKYKCKCWTIRAFSQTTRHPPPKTATAELALTECYNTMIKRIGTKFAATNIYYIKMFQALAYSADFAANDELIAYFRDYTDNVSFTESEYSVSVLADLSEYAKTVGYELSFFEDGDGDGGIVPAKSGSISLVFYGTICKLQQPQQQPQRQQPQQQPSPIVVKYLRANMRRRVLDSIDDFKYLVWCLNKIPSLRYLHLNDIYNEQRVLMMDQLDFAKEAACIGEVYQNCKEMRCIKVPITYPEFTERFPNIIVMERIMGKTLDQLDDDVKDHFCHIFARGLVKMVFIDGLYHCDLHPGNIIFIEDDNENATTKYRIGLLDFGIIGRLTVDEQDITYQVFHGILNKDAERTIATLMESYTEPVDDSRECNRTDPEMMDALICYIREMMKTVVTCFSAENLCFINKQLIKNNLKIARSFTKFELSLSVCDNLCKKLAVNRSYLNHLTEIISDVFE